MKKYACCKNAGQKICPIYIAWSAPFVTSCEVVRKLGSFRLIAPRWPSTAAGAVSLKLPNFLTTSQDVTKGADQAIYYYSNFGIFQQIFGIITSGSCPKYDILKVLQKHVWEIHKGVLSTIKKKWEDEMKYAPNAPFHCGQKWLQNFLLVDHVVLIGTVWTRMVLWSPSKLQNGSLK